MKAYIQILQVIILQQELVVYLNNDFQDSETMDILINNNYQIMKKEKNLTVMHKMQIL
jgi:hypothetical protein